MHFAVEFRRIFILLLVIKSVLGRIPTYSLGEPEGKKLNKVPVISSLFKTEENQTSIILDFCMLSKVILQENQK